MPLVQALARLRRPLETRAIAGKRINRLGFYSSRRRMRLLELIDLADMLGMIRPETNRCSNAIFSDPGARCTYPLEKSGLATFQRKNNRSKSLIKRGGEAPETARTDILCAGCAAGGPSQGSIGGCIAV